MFPLDTLLTYLVAALVVVISPGPDNILAISRGLSQGRAAACLSSLGAGLGIMVHTLAAALGLSLVIQTSPLAFWAVKIVGAVYLVWLGVKALRSHDLIRFDDDGTNTDTTSRCGQLPLRQVLLTGWLSNVLNPKPGLFVLAFLPQFVSASRGDVATQMLVYGALFAVLTTIIFSVLGSSAARLSGWLSRHPRVGTGLNVGAGLTFVAAGVSVLAIKARM
jgi:threonine/homoserine/homoserine lactone efflux protein